MLRREFLRYGTTAATLALLGGAENRYKALAETDTQPNSFIETDPNDPILRAATLDIQGKREDGRYFKGKGGLLRYKGNLGILTVNHVIQNMTDLFFTLQGQPITRMDQASLRAAQEQAGVVDQAVFMSLATKHVNLVENLERAHLASPLTLDTIPVVSGDQVAIPSTGYYLFDVEATQSQKAEFRLKNRSIVPICAGMSGTPVLRLFEEKIGTEIVGVVTSIPTKLRLNTDPNSYEYKCSLSVNVADIRAMLSS